MAVNKESPAVQRAGKRRSKELLGDDSRHSLRGLAARLLLEVNQTLPAHLEMPPPSRSSAFGCRADTERCHEESPLMTHSGRSMSPRELGWTSNANPSIP